MTISPPRGVLWAMLNAFQKNKNNIVLIPTHYSKSRIYIFLRIKSTIYIYGVFQVKRN